MSLAGQFCVSLQVRGIENLDDITHQLSGEGSLETGVRFPDGSLAREAPYSRNVIEAVNVVIDKYWIRRDT